MMTPEQEEEARQRHADQVADLDGRQAREDLSTARYAIMELNRFEDRGGHSRFCDNRHDVMPLTDECTCDLVTHLLAYYPYDTLDYEKGILVTVNLQSDITLDRDATGTPAVWSIRKNDS